MAEAVMATLNKGHGRSRKPPSIPVQSSRKAKASLEKTTPATVSVYARMGELVGQQVNSEMDLVVLVRSGLPAKSIRTLKDALGLDTELVAPETTLRRRLQDNKPLTTDETERMIRIARITSLAEALFEDKDAAHAWLNTPAQYLRGEPAISPIALSSTDPGARLVESMILRTEHGLF